MRGTATTARIQWVAIACVAVALTMISGPSLLGAGPGVFGSPALPATGGGGSLRIASGDPLANVTVVPTQGQVGSDINISGGGFLPDAPLLLYLNSSSGSDQFASCTSNSTGNFSCVEDVPAVVAGPYELNVTDTVDNGTTNFTVLPPSISVDPTDGYVGNVTAVNGSGFTPNYLLDLDFNDSSITSCTAGSITTNSTGSFSCSFPVPPQPFGNEIVNASDAFNYATATFHVRPHFLLNRTVGPYRTEIGASGLGFPGTSVVTVSWDGSVTLCSPSTASNGTFACSFSVPLAPNGSHTISATSGAAVGTATFQVIPSASLSRYLVLPGNPITAYGYGFDASAPIKVKWDLLSTVCSGTTNATGAISCGFDVPPTTYGEHNVSLVQGGLIATQSLNVSTQFSINPTLGAVETVVTLTGAGFAGSTKYDMCLESSSTSSCPSGSPTFTTNASGSIPSGTTFTIPAGATNPSYVIVSLGSTVLEYGQFTVTIGTLSATPSSGSVGTAIAISGSGYAVSTKYYYCIQTGLPAGCPGGTTTSFITTASGDIPTGVSPLYAPWGPAGTYNLDVSDVQGALVNSTAFTLVANLSASVYQSTVGGQVTVSGSAFPVTSAITVSMLTGASSPAQVCAPASTLSNGTGGFECTFLTPPAAWGPELVRAYAGAASASFSLSVVATVSLNVSSGSVGTHVNASASGFIGVQGYTVLWAGHSTLCSDVTNVTGSFYCQFVVPASPQGAQAVMATAGASSNSTDFTISPSASLAPVSGPVGSPAAVSGTGFEKNGPYTVLWNDSLPVCTGDSADAVGNLSCQFTAPGSPGVLIPVLVEQGSNSITLYFTVTPSVTLSSHVGNVGSRVESIAYGLLPGSAYSIAWNSSLTLCSGSAPGSGTYFCNFTVPFAPEGDYSLTAFSGGANYPVEFSVIPAIATSATTGPVGSPVTVQGNGFPSSAAYSVDWNTSTTVCAGTTNASGGFSCEFAVPSTVGGTHDYNVTQGSRQFEASFRIVASVALSATSLAAGDTLTVTGDGFAADGPYRVIWNDTNVVCSGTTNSTGGFVCPFTVPPVTPGSYSIIGVQGTVASAAVTLTVTSVTPPPPPASSSPFPWWYVVIVVVVILGAFLAVLLLRRRRPSRRPGAPRPWDESGPDAGPRGSATAPVPLHSVPARAAATSAVAPVPLDDSDAAKAAAEPPEDVDALIERLERIAEQVYRRKPASEAGAAAAQTKTETK